MCGALKGGLGVLGEIQSGTGIRDGRLAEPCILKSDNAAQEFTKDVDDPLRDGFVSGSRTFEPSENVRVVVDGLPSRDKRRLVDPPSEFLVRDPCFADELGEPLVRCPPSRLRGLAGCVLRAGTGKIRPGGRSCLSWARGCGSMVHRRAAELWVCHRHPTLTW
nr:hypothetical protein KPHV_86350 [Kitasatospora purpeofusca]